MTTINFIYLGGLTGHFSSPPLTPSPRTRQPQTHPQKSNFLSVKLPCVCSPYCWSCSEWRRPCKPSGKFPLTTTRLDANGTNSLTWLVGFVFIRRPTRRSRASRWPPHVIYQFGRNVFLAERRAIAINAVQPSHAIAEIHKPRRKDGGVYSMTKWWCPAASGTARTM